MGLLDIVGGMLAGRGGPGGQAGRAGSAGGLGGLDDLLRQLGGQGGVAGAGQAGGPAALLGLVLSLLANNGQSGGLGGLLQRFQAAGLGEQADSWVGTGRNLPVSPEQMSQVFGRDQMSQMAERVGLSTGDLSTQLAQLLPQAVDEFTPQGRAPEGGLGDLGDLLGQLMRR